MNLSPASTYNYLVPADGTTHTVTLQAVLTGNPAEVDWNEFAQSNFKFYPQGAYVDNSQGTGPLLLSIPSISFNAWVPAGSYQALPFPSPARCVMQISGANPAAVINFVDYPVMPSAPVTSSGMAAGADVTITNVPLPTSDEALDPIVTATGAPAANALTVQGAPGAVTVSEPLNASTATGISATVSLAGMSNATACMLATVTATVEAQVSPDGVNWYTAATLTASAASSLAVALPDGMTQARFNVTANTGAVTAQIAARANNGLQS